MIRPATPDDADPILALADVAIGFGPDEVAVVRGTLRGAGGASDVWVVDDGAGGGDLAAVAYYAPERMTDRTWNLLLIAVRPESQRSGRGAAMLRHVEADLAGRGGRLLLVETMDVPELEPARRFYRKQGFAEQGRVGNFYAAGAGKVIFAKLLG